MWRQLSLGTQTGSQYLQMIGEIRNGVKGKMGRENTLRKQVPWDDYSLSVSVC